VREQILSWATFPCPSYSLFLVWENKYYLGHPSHVLPMAFP